ncbi:MAG: lactonase family protein [Pirellulaceae bacterium]
MRDTKRWQLAGVAGTFAVWLASGLCGFSPEIRAADQMLVYIGTYAAETEDGIHVYQLELATGQLTRIGAVAGITNPSFQALHPDGQFLYSVSESNDYEGQPAGAIHACAIDPDTGLLTLLNSQSSMGPGPCHLMVDKAGKHVLTANYGGGSVAVLPLEPDGRVEMACAFIQHEGSSVHARQKGPHAHCINLDVHGRFALSADLGLDQVLIYQYDARDGSIRPNPIMPAAHVPPGSGPRHFAFHPRGTFGYVINELTSTINAFAYDGQRGELRTLQEVSTLPPDFEGENSTAEIVVSPDGKFLYGSNRGHHSVVVFAIDQQSGKLTHVSHHSTLGEQPRNFAIDPTGAYLVAANQRTDNVVVFRVDPATGRLSPTEQSIKIPSPVCVTFLAR